MPNVIQNADLIERLYFEVMQLGDLIMQVDNMNDPDLEDAICDTSIALKNASDGLFNASKAIETLRREVA
jgi:hypothetical protein